MFAKCSIVAFWKAGLCSVTDTNEGRKGEEKKIFCEAAPGEVSIPLADNAEFSNYSETVKLPGLLSLHKDAAPNIFISQNRKI